MRTVFAALLTSCTHSPSLQQSWPVTPLWAGQCWHCIPHTQVEHWALTFITPAIRSSKLDSPAFLSHRTSSTPAVCLDSPLLDPIIQAHHHRHHIYEEDPVNMISDGDDAVHTCSPTFILNKLRSVLHLSNYPCSACRLTLSIIQWIVKTRQTLHTHWTSVSTYTHTIHWQLTWLISLVWHQRTRLRAMSNV
jgi:hypothetical protein